MRDKIVFFILGALLTTIAYFAGDLETLTAEDKITELEELRVNILRVNDAIVVGDIGEKTILIATTNESAEIKLYGAEKPNNSGSSGDFMNNIGNKPSISLKAIGDGAMMRVVSHDERPEASCYLGIIAPEGKYESDLILKDLDGINGVSTD